jgi:hypothetical protein
MLSLLQVVVVFHGGVGDWFSIAVTDSGRALRHPEKFPYVDRAFIISPGCPKLAKNRYSVTSGYI